MVGPRNIGGRQRLLFRRSLAAERWTAEYRRPPAVLSLISGGGFAVLVWLRKLREVPA
jgi:hypothetical protein